MVERFVRWLLKKAGILSRFEVMELLMNRVVERELVEIKEKLASLEEKQSIIEEKQTVFEEAQSQAEVLDEWLNGRSK